MSTIPEDLKSFLINKFTVASSSYIGETCSNIKIRIEEHIKSLTNLIFLNIYILMRHALTRITLFSLK